MVQSGAGAGSGFGDRDYRAAGAEIVRSAAARVGARAMVLKVKEPQRPSTASCAAGLMLFTYLHLAAEPAARA